MQKKLCSKSVKVILLILVFLILISYTIYKYFNKCYVLSMVDTGFNCYEINEINIFEENNKLDIKNIPRNMYNELYSNNVLNCFTHYAIKKAFFYKNKPQNNIKVSFIYYPYENSESYINRWNICLYEDGYMYIENLTDKDFESGYYKIDSFNLNEFYQNVKNACIDLKIRVDNYNN